MPRRLMSLFAAVAVGGLASLAAAGAAPAQTSPVQALAGLSHRPVCAVPSGSMAACASRIVTDGSGHPLATTSYTNGYAPADLSSAYAYSLPVAGSNWVSNGQTVAIVDAYRDPNAEADLAAYRSQFNLPPCSSADGCFQEVDQNGGSSLPGGNNSWAQEISLDLDMVSAVCPMCRILLVDGSSAGTADLGSAVNTAVRLGATAVSNSYGTNGEYSSEASDAATYYNHPGVAVVASAGDAGYGVSFPAVAPLVTAVGGTSLSRASTARGWSEKVWSGTGSGCSSIIAQQSWQTSRLSSQNLTGCSHRVVGDVAAVADPNTGVAVYDSYGSSGGANWLVFGGTSVSSPIIASFFARANAASNASSSQPTSYVYSHAGSLNDVTSGSNGRCTSRRSTTGAWLCTAGTGYDGPTGLGTPNGLGAF